MKDYSELVEAQNTLDELNHKFEAFFGRLSSAIQDSFYDYLEETEFKDELYNVFEVQGGSEITGCALNSDGSFCVSWEYEDSYEDLYDEQKDISYPKDIIESYLSEDKELLKNLVVRHCKDRQIKESDSAIEDSIKLLELYGYTVTK